MVLALKILKIVILIIIFTYVTVLALLFFYQKKLIFYPTRSDRNTKLSLPGVFTEGFLQLSDETSVHYLVQKVESPKGVILYFHGNAGCLDQWGYVAYELAIKSGYDVWMMDYPGFGKSSEALPSNEKILIEMGQQLIAKIRAEQPKLSLVLYGRSIGSGVAGSLARTEKVEGLVLETPYTSLLEMTHEIFPWVPSLLVQFDLDSMRLSELKIPIKTLILHGTADEVIPYRLGERLAQNLKCQIVTVAGGHHNDLSEFDNYWPEVLKFLNSIPK